MTFLKINNLSVNYEMRRETVYAAKKVNINVEKGEILGLVGESGSGKSTVGNAIINLIDEPGKVSGGSIILDGTDIYENPENILKLRGKKIGLIFQDPQTSLNPILTIGEQLIETIQTHLKLGTEEAKNSAIKNKAVQPKPKRALKILVSALQIPRTNAPKIKPKIYIIKTMDVLLIFLSFFLKKIPFSFLYV